MLTQPTFEPRIQAAATLYDFRSSSPLLNRRFAGLDEHPFATVLDRRQPELFASKRNPHCAYLQLAFHVRSAGLAAGEAELGHHLAEPTNENNPSTPAIHGLPQTDFDNARAKKSSSGVSRIGATER
ncbi:MAG TPA: hypothetical protein VMG10_24730 [Gemmataceae bacterium]|nr:hypothetical protein [Gemmataceae bacterium]